MTKQNEPKSELCIVQFLVPKYDRDRKAYPRSIHQSLRKYLEDEFGGWSSLGDRPLPGAWRNPDSGDIEYDESWRYEVGIASDRLRRFDDFLAGLAHRLGQKAIWRVVYEGGKGEAVAAKPPGKKAP